MSEDNFYSNRSSEPSTEAPNQSINRQTINLLNRLSAQNDHPSRKHTFELDMTNQTMNLGQNNLSKTLVDQNQTEHTQTSVNLQLKNQLIVRNLNHFYESKGLSKFISEQPIDDNIDMSPRKKSKGKPLTFWQKIYGIPPPAMLKEKILNIFDVFRIGRFSAVYSAYFHSLKMEVVCVILLTFLSIAYYVTLLLSIDSFHIHNYPACSADFSNDASEDTLEAAKIHSSINLIFLYVCLSVTFVCYWIFRRSILSSNKFKYLNGIDESDFCLMVKGLSHQCTKQQIINFFQSHLCVGNEATEISEIMDFFWVQNTSEYQKARKKLSKAYSEEKIQALNDIMDEQIQFANDEKLKQGIGIVSFRSIESQKKIFDIFPNSKFGQIIRNLTCRATEQFSLEGKWVYVQELPNPENFIFENENNSQCISMFRWLCGVFLNIFVILAGTSILFFLQIKPVLFDKGTEISNFYLTILQFLIAIILSFVNEFISSKIIPSSSKNTIEQASCNSNIVVSLTAYSVVAIMLSIFSLNGEGDSFNHQNLLSKIHSISINLLIYIFTIPFIKAFKSMKFHRYQQRKAINDGNCSSLSQYQIERRLLPNKYSFKGNLGLRSQVFILVITGLYFTPYLSSFFGMIAFFVIAISDRFFILRASKPLSFRNVSFGGVFYRPMRIALILQSVLLMFKINCYGGWYGDVFKIVSASVVGLVLLSLIFAPSLSKKLKESKLIPDLKYDQIEFHSTYFGNYPFNTKQERNSDKSQLNEM